MQSRLPYVWDYAIDEAQFYEILTGQIIIGRLDRDWAAVRLIEYAPYCNNKYRLGASPLDQCAFARRICGRFTGSRRKANRTVKRRRTSYVRLLFTVRFLTSYLPIRRFHLGGKQRPQIFTGQDCLLLIQI